MRKPTYIVVANDGTYSDEHVLPAAEKIRTEWDGWGLGPCSLELADDGISALDESRASGYDHACGYHD